MILLIITIKQAVAVKNYLYALSFIRLLFKKQIKNMDLNNENKKIRIMFNINNHNSNHCHYGSSSHRIHYNPDGYKNHTHNQWKG